MLLPAKGWWRSCLARRSHSFVEWSWGREFEPLSPQIIFIYQKKNNCYYLPNFVWLLSDFLIRLLRSTEHVISLKTFVIWQLFIANLTCIFFWLQTRTNSIAWNPMEPMNFTAVRQELKLRLYIYNCCFAVQGCGFRLSFNDIVGNLGCLRVLSNLSLIVDICSHSRVLPNVNWDKYLNII